MNSKAYIRQMSLVEVGLEGQARLSAARVSVPGGDALSSVIAARYLEGAGCTVVAGEVVGGESGESEASARASLGLAHGPEAVAEGALAALVAVRAVLGLGAPGDMLDDTRGPAVAAW